MKENEFVRLSMEDDSEVYVGLVEGPRHESVPPNPRIRKSWKWYAKWIAFWVSLLILVVIALKWIGPFFMKKVIVPIIQWEMTTFSPPRLALIIFASLAIFPVACLPSTPSMWIAGMTFGYGLGFLLVLAGVSVGVSLPYFIGSLFQSKINEYLAKHPNHASVLKLAGEGDWYHQFQAIILIRISPFPYPVFNYAVVATDVVYTPYLLGSLVGTVPDVLIALYSGILIQSFAEATQDPGAETMWQIILKVVGFCVAVASTIVIGMYTKRQLDHQQARVLNLTME